MSATGLMGCCGAGLEGETAAPIMSCLFVCKEVNKKNCSKVKEQSLNTLF